MIEYSILFYFILFYINCFSYHDTTPYAVKCMKEVKDAIRERSKRGECKLVENYKDPSHLRDLLLEDLKKAIQNDFPIDASYPSP